MFATIEVARMMNRVKVGGSIVANGLTERFGIDWRGHRLHPDRVGTSEATGQSTPPGKLLGWAPSGSIEDPKVVG